MKHLSRTLRLVSSALAVSFMLVACGGGDAEPPPDLIPPTVAITDSVASAVATGDVTFTFTFSESVGSSFDAGDVTVAGGTKGAFTMAADSRSATLVVVPTADSSGTMTVSVAAGAFSDIAGNPSTVAFTASQDYDTVVVPPPTGGLVLASFDESPAREFFGFGGAEGSSIATGPEGGTGLAAKILRMGGLNFAGAVVTVGPIGLSATANTITARVYSDVAGVPMALKLENAADANINTGELAAQQAVVQGWQTLSWVVPADKLGGSYDRVAMLPNFGTVASEDPGETYYFDDIKLVGGTAPPPPGGGTVLTNFDDVLPVGDLGQFGDAAASIAEAPAGGSGAALKLDRSGAINFGGTFYTVAPAIPFAADRKTITARVFATRANAVIYLKVEAAGGVFTEVPATVTAANTWETLTWNLASVNPASSYATVVISADTDVAIGGAQTYWVDDITLVGEAAPPPPPTGGTVLTNFDDVLPVGDLGQFGDAAASIAEAPAGGSGAALKLDRSGAINFGGTFYTVAPAIPFAADRKTVTARVYATRANAVVYLKVEAPGGVFTEVPATVTAANTWETLTWNLASVNPASSYATVVISADTEVAIGGAQTYWVDDITLVGATTGGGGVTVLTYSSGFASFDRTIDGGAHGGFSGSNQDGFACKFDPAICGNGGEFAPPLAAADSYFFNYYQTAVPATALYSGVFVLAPGVTALNDFGDSPGVTIANQTRLNITVGQNAEWFSSTTNNFLISMDLGKFYTLGGGAGCRLQVRAVVTPTAAEATYAVPLNSFALVQNCGGVASSAAQAFALSPISQINVQANGGEIALEAGGKFSGANLTVPTTEGLYPTTIVIKGGITFD